VKIFKIEMNLFRFNNLATIDVTLFRQYFFNCSIIEIEGRTFDVSQYFLEDIIQLLNFQPINSTSTTRKQANKNRQLQDDDDDQGYEDSQTDDIEVFVVFCLFICRMCF
jgi:HrpA-like RNA helicase